MLRPYLCLWLYIPKHKYIAENHLCVLVPYVTSLLSFVNCSTLVHASSHVLPQHKTTMSQLCVLIPHVIRYIVQVEQKRSYQTGHIIVSHAISTPRAV